MFADPIAVQGRSRSALRELENQIKQDDFALSQIDPADLASLYLREVSHVPLLSAEEEVALAKRIEAGRVARQQLGLAIDDPEQRAALIRTKADGQAAEEHLIKANSRLVLSVARKYVRRGVPLIDLIQEGNLGLMRAVKKFDYRRGYKFSTYATWWIRQAVSRAVADQGRTIRVPVHMHEQINRLARTRQQLIQALGREPTNDEIAKALDVPLSKVEQILRASQRPMSLDTPVGEDEDSYLGDFIGNTDADSVDATTEQHLRREAVAETLHTLSPREEGILRLRFGLTDGHSYTLTEIGEKYGLTRERIRQIEADALNKLRAPRRSRQLRDYLPV